PKFRLVIVYNPDETKYYTGCRTIVIPNFIFELPLIFSAQKKKTILTVGWLIHRKGVDLIPAIAAKFLLKYAGWNWTIIGEGELKQELLLQIHELGLQGRVIIQEPIKPLVAADYQGISLFVMTSRIEPFGLVLIEAMSNKVSCIAFDCESGPRHIITHKEDGWLIPPEDIDAMAEAIETLVADESQRAIMAEKALENVRRFTAENVYEQWKKVIYAD
ncbi:MAG TPA: glycosyltransferase, partial [Flavisolibacter sp.]